MSVDASTLRVVPANTAPVVDVITVFGTRGDPSTCWCQWYKIRGTEWSDADPEHLKALLIEQLQAPGAGPGLLAYDGDTPVGWCGVEPRSNLPRAEHSTMIAGGTEHPNFTDTGVWAITCFVIPRQFRRRGVAGALAAAAVEHARVHGASVIEAYAVDPTIGEKQPAADLFPGTVSMFAGAGFTEVARPKPHRVIMQVRPQTEGTRRNAYHRMLS
ncbi:MAG TPA: GNAT family N-acetyltransferase [Candidatus Lumbricidophila sp.]|nr:GNAT family N-acetyltransferase [Candidatus Lumbricidophila sp.]